MPLKGFDRIVEARIQGAIAEGSLDHLSGAGKPEPPDDLAGLAGDERVEALLLRSLGGVPEEVHLLQEIARLRARLARAADADERDVVQAELATVALRLSLLFETAGRHLSARNALELAR